MPMTDDEQRVKNARRNLRSESEKRSKLHQNVNGNYL